jgi:hypothetical protein
MMLQEFINVGSRMKPIYFPYTYLPPSVAHSLRAVFPSVAVYQPVAGCLPDEMQALAEKGVLEVVAPPPGDEADFDRLMRDFQQWGCLHQGGAGLKTLMLQDLLFSQPISPDGSPAEIISEIKRRLAPEPAARDSEPALMARAFLYLAQTADRQEFQIANDLARYEEARGRLLDALKGPKDPAGPEFGLWAGSDRNDDREDRLELRMAAWARLFSSHPYPSPVFITQSQAVIRRLRENVPGCLRLSFAQLPRTLQQVAREERPPAGDLMTQLAALAAAPLSRLNPLNDAAEEKSARDGTEEPRFHLWLEIPPHRFFAHPRAAGLTEPHPPPPQSTWRHTVIVQMGQGSQRAVG